MLIGFRFAFPKRAVTATLHPCSCFLQRSKVLNSQKYGVDLVRSVHSGSDTCLCASRNETDHDLRYWDLWENKYIRYFKGHKGPVLSLDVHPYEDVVLSSGADGLAMVRTQLSHTVSTCTSVRRAGQEFVSLIVCVR